MRRDLPGGYQLDDDPRRIDIDVVCGYLATEYWSSHRTRDEQERLVRGSTRVVGLYSPDGAQAGFCRAVSDGGSFAWLGDVFVMPSHRGKGLGEELVREAVEHPAHRDLTWYLGTRDAHDLYRRFGFTSSDDRMMSRSRRRLEDV